MSVGVLQRQTRLPHTAEAVQDHNLRPRIASKRKPGVHLREQVLAASQLWRPGRQPYGLASDFRSLVRQLKLVQLLDKEPASIRQAGAGLEATTKSGAS
jgi:hypothetical protein